MCLDLYGVMVLPLWFSFTWIPIICGSASVAVLPELLVRCIDCINGNDIAGINMGKSVSLPVLCERPQQASARLQQLVAGATPLPLCAVKRSMAQTRQVFETVSARNEAGDGKPEELEQEF